MGMLRLAPEIQEHILSMPVMVPRPSVSERALRPIEPITDCRDQLREFYKFSVKAFGLEPPHGFPHHPLKVACLHGVCSPFGFR